MYLTNNMNHKKIMLKVIHINRKNIPGEKTEDYNHILETLFLLPRLQHEHN